MAINRRASGSLFGMALGDALGAKTEFINVAEILHRYPPNGPQQPEGNPAQVTDDTQMALAVGEALLSAEKPYTAATLEEPLRREFIRWNNSPENNRAPGMTCIRACENLEKGMPWVQATIANSKGCGANMRVTPVGLLPNEKDGITLESRAAMAQFQAALTHGHATGLAASDLTAVTVAFLLEGISPADLPARLRAYSLSQREVYHADWLGTLWERPGVSSPQEYISRGWDECLAVLDRLEAALAKPDRTTDPCRATGEGWVAEEAFATGLLCFLYYPEDPLAVLRRAAVTSGDSDSIACLAGAFAGAYLGMEAWPEEWVNRTEYREQLAKLGSIWD